MQLLIEVLAANVAALALLKLIFKTLWFFFEGTDDEDYPVLNEFNERDY